MNICNMYMYKCIYINMYIYIHMNSFKWDFEAEFFPGWVLTQPWLSAEGMANRGILSVR